MKSRSSARIIAILTAIAIGIFAWTLVTTLFYVPTGEVDNPWLAAHAPAVHAASTALPERLIIPAIDIDARVQQVGVKADGSMATPSNFTDVGWYKYGTIPGQIGSAVLAGHVDNALSLPGVFKRLSDLKVGDDVYVEQKDGSRLHFVVTDIKSYVYDGAPEQLIFGQNDSARLNLVTCEGTWLKSAQTYDKRLVVFTKLVL